MESSFALFSVFSLILVGNAIAARKDPEEYWKDGKKNPAANYLTATSKVSKEQAKQLLKDFEHKVEKAFTEDFEARLNVFVYHDDSKLGEKSFEKDFELRPNVSIYHDNELAASKEYKSFVKDFEPRPNVFVYND